MYQYYFSEYKRLDPPAVPGAMCFYMASRAADSFNQPPLKPDWARPVTTYGQLCMRRQINSER